MTDVETEKAVKFKDGSTAIWRRQQRGGFRRITEIEVTVVSRTPAGNYVVRHGRDGREVTSVVMASSLAKPQ